MERVANRTKLKTIARWPRVGGVPYQASDFSRIKFARAKKVGKEEGEPGDEASDLYLNWGHWYKLV